jgi:hypothetical protein
MMMMAMPTVMIIKKRIKAMKMIIMTIRRIK